MAKPKRTAKKRTKTAVAARRYERRLKQRVKAGDEDAIGIVERRKEYSRRYEEKRRQMRATEDESRGHEDTNSEHAVGGLLEGIEEESRTGTSPLFCTPAPPTTLKGVLGNSSTGKARVQGKDKRSVSGHALKVLDLGDSDEEDELSHRRGGRKPSVVTTGGARPSPSPERQTGGRGRLVRRYVGGMLAEDPSAAPLLRRSKQTPSLEDTTESLVVQLQKNRTEQEILRANQEKLRAGEVELLVKLNSRGRQP